jgi:hypothetical protein
MNSAYALPDPPPLTPQCPPPFPPRYVIVDVNGRVLRNYPSMSKEVADNYADRLTNLASKASHCVRDLDATVRRHGRGQWHGGGVRLRVVKERARGGGGGGVPFFSVRWHCSAIN